MKHIRLPISLFLLFLIILLTYTRFVNLGWGLPYPMHPDERNMVLGIMAIRCDTVQTFDCLNPHFFAYGQLPLFTAYFLVKAGQFVMGNVGQVVIFEDATMALRTISAFCAVLTGLFLYLTFRLLTPILFKKKQVTIQENIVDTRVQQIITLLILFIPGLIQFAHYGTTESLLMMTYSGLVYCSLRLLRDSIKPWMFVLWTGLLTGVALASKVSALPFLGVPGVAILVYFISKLIILLKKKKKSKKDILMTIGGFFATGIGYTALSAALGLGLSPFNILSFAEFQGSMRYETGVGFGDTLVFYTRSFFMTTPVLFQIQYIVPFILGLPLFLFSLYGIFFLPWKKREITFLRYAFVLYFIPESMIYAKWARFIAPVFPVMVVFALLGIYYLYRLGVKKVGAVKEKYIRYTLIAIVLIAMLPGMAYLAIYIKPDVRYVATEWMYKNIPENSYLLAETANVVDIPAPPKMSIQRAFPNYRYISFDFYNLDINPLLTSELEEHLRQADYVIVNSRRVFKNHTCLAANELSRNVPLSIDQTIRVPDPFTDQQKRCEILAQTYPQLQKYYDDLFSGRSGFTLAAEFTSYPDISFLGVPLIEFPDENAEETWSVFDHPVIRIYKRIKS